jgi:hypothetical protein
MLVQQIYPTNQKLRSEIPLWLKFRAFEYQGYFGRASGTFDGIQPSPPNQLGTIYVPAPPSLVSGVSNKFNASPMKTIFDSLANLISGAGSFIPTPKGGLNPLKAAGAGINALGELTSTFYTLSSYFLDIVPPDFNDNIYGGTSKRVYKFSLVLPCLTDEDSFAAFAIGRAFEAFSIPATASNILAFKHPPMWLFGVGPGTGPSIDFTWLTDPQLCVLANVAVNRSAPDNGTYTVFTRYGLKPSVTTIALEFVEIEPVYREEGTLSIISRSQAFQQVGNLNSVFGE